MEALDSKDVAEWVRAQNALSEPWLRAIPQREAIESRLKTLWNYERFGVPAKESGRYFFTKNDGLQNQAVLYVLQGLAGEPRVVLDPNGLSEDGTVSLSRWFPSQDGRHIAYGTSDGGSDWTDWRIRRIDDGKDLPEKLVLTKFTPIAWSPKGDGFYYSRYPAGSSGRGDDHKPVSVYYHALGTPQGADRLIYDLGHATRDPYAVVTDDGRFLVLSIEEGTIANGLYYLDLTKPGGQAVRLLDRWDAIYAFLGNDGRTFYVQTNKDAPRGRIVAIDLDAPEPASWKTLVPEAPEALSSASYVGGRLFASYLKDAHSVVRTFGRDGRMLSNIELPGTGTAEGFKGRQDDRETFFSYTDFMTPPAIYRYDLATGAVEPFRSPKVGVDRDAYSTEQVFFASKDGTRVPMFITRRKNFARDGNAPTILYGYGGFNISLTPAFSATVMTWLDMGGVFAVANLRGGGEYGKEWHEAGTLLRKQNVFDDFIAAAEYLIRERYTSPRRLAIQGGSNGGLLVGAMVTQRPDLFGAALPDVGVLDMLRYHTASANARQWSTDYGLSENAAQFRAQLAYSPVHNVKNGTCYPPTLITTADHDDRVVPWHSFKFAARLQAAQSCANPILIRVETRAGHGAGTPTWMRIEQAADKLAFVAQRFGLATPPQ